MRSMLGEVDRIINNQWPIYFNISVESFRPHVPGFRHLFDFTGQAKKQVPAISISSSAVADGWKEPCPVREGPIRLSMFLTMLTGDPSSLVVSSWRK